MNKKDKEKKRKIFKKKVQENNKHFVGQILELD